jgi:hypothetical protein
MSGRCLAVGLSLVVAGSLTACASTPEKGGGAQRPGSTVDSRPSAHPSPEGTLSRVRTGSGSPSDDAPSRVVPSSKVAPSETLATCTQVPASSGPLVHAASLAVTAPAAAAPGQTVTVSATVTSTATVPRVVTTPATSAVLLVQGKRVVGRALGAPAAAPVPLVLAAGADRPAQAVPRSVRLVGCGSAALPAGRYTLVAVLGYQLDPVNAAPDAAAAPSPGGRRFALVSAPAPITIG